MRILADENFPGGAVNALRAEGQDVVWIRDLAAGASDADVLRWAVREQRLLLTFDKDFGELARRSKLPAACGVILFRIAVPGIRDVGKKLASLVDAGNDWSGHFSVIEPGRVRMRPLR